MDLLKKALLDAGAVPRLVAPRIGAVKAEGGKVLQADASMENEPGFLFDALVLPDGQAAVDALGKDGHTMEFIKDQYRHGKTILALGASKSLLEKAGVPLTLPDGKPDQGLILAGSSDAQAAATTFIQGVARGRHPERETDPPRV